MQKIKIFNDPVHGFISIPKNILFDLIEHPYFQRLKRIKQLGLTHMVYPGALHTRFHHAMGAYHLMSNALEILRNKGASITDEEFTSASAAILLHDIGHGPYSHTLEKALVPGISHEELSLLFMYRLNDKFDGRLDQAIEIFRNRYPKKYLHELVSSQLDVDRLDYLSRDSFYTGVSEGTIGLERIIKMLNVFRGRLVIEHKGIYSIEKFLISRRLMYWQVYLHKTVVSCENLLLKILERARELAGSGTKLFATPAFQFFLYNEIKEKEFLNNPKVLDTFAHLDDHDIMVSIKTWAQTNVDKILSTLCKKLINRQLFKITFSSKPFKKDIIKDYREKVAKQFRISEKEAQYFVFSDSVTNAAYLPEKGENINIYYKDNSTLDIADASDQYNISALSNPVQKYFLCYPKNSII